MIQTQISEWGFLENLPRTPRDSEYRWLLYQFPNTPTQVYALYTVRNYIHKRILYKFQMIELYLD